MRTKFEPDLSKRPHKMTVERQMKASPSELYDAWTRRFDRWFAQPGDLVMVPEIDTPFFFYSRYDWGRSAHYGRFLELKKNELVEMTWVTPKEGTQGAETVIRIDFEPNESGTLLTLTHSGFENEESCKAHLDNWPDGLEILDEALTRN